VKAKNRIPLDSLSENSRSGRPANEIAKKIVDAFVIRICWYASAGGSTSPTFALAFGRKGDDKPRSRTRLIEGLST
jgi:hypothetical protein